jgi:hypothetical protein
VPTVAPKIEIPLPSLRQARKETVDPSVPKLKAETAEPNRVDDRSDKLDPIFRHPIQLNDVEKRAVWALSPPIDMEEPRRTTERMESAEPSATEFKTDTLWLKSTKERTLSEEFNFKAPRTDKA